MVFACFRCSAPAPHWVLPRQHVSAQAAVAAHHADHSTAPRPPGDAHISPKLSLLERRFCSYTWIHSRQTLLTFCILLSCICLSIQIHMYTFSLHLHTPLSKKIHLIYQLNGHTLCMPWTSKPRYTPLIAGS